MQIATQHNPLVSVVIPVRNSAATLDLCLRAVKHSYYRNIEVIVVDDHSTDQSAEIAGRYDCLLLSPGAGMGANNARNFGAQKAKGEILIFLDSDIVVGRETILTVVETIEEEGVDAAVGLYTARHRHETFVSQYKNLWVRYSYLKSPASIDWLFGAISGIRRSAFERLGGFNSELLAQYGHDDIELGKRFARANLSIVLNMDIEVEHLKSYTMRSFIRNEFKRSIGFAELAVKTGEAAQSLGRGFVNVYPSFVLSTALPLILLLLGVCVVLGWVPLWSIAVAGGVYFLLNIRFLNYLEQVRGLFAMMAMIPLLLIDHAVCFAGSCVGALRGLRANKSR